MKPAVRVLKMLQKVGVRSGQTVLDFGCGLGMYTILVARIVGEHGCISLFLFPAGGGQKETAG